MKAMARVSVLGLTMLAAVAGTVWGQKPFALAPRAGVVLSTIEFEDPATDAQTSTLIGFRVGIRASKELTGSLSVEAGLELSREGFGGEGAHTGDVRSDYLSLPILLRAKAPGPVPVHLIVGGAAKLSLRCSQVGVAEVGNAPCDDPIMGVGLARGDLVGLVGLGGSFGPSRRTLTADLTVSVGLRDLDDGLHVPGGARAISIGFGIALFRPWHAWLGRAAS